MDFFDKLGKKASETYKNTTQMTNKIGKEVKIKVSISDKKDQISDIYTKIGENVYRLYLENKDLEVDSSIKQELENLDTLTDEITTLQEELLLLKDQKKCPKCSALISKEDDYCPKCGKKQEKIKEDVVQEVEVVDEKNSKKDSE